MRFAPVITQWFAQGGGSLMLPDGWYGRPHDSIHRLTRLQEDDGTLTLCLDDHLTLCFNGLTSVQQIGRNRNV